MLTTLGYVGASLLCVCGIPLLFSTRWGDRLFLWAWFLGEVAMLYYTALVDGPGPYLINYAFNTLLVGFVLARRRGSR